MSIHTVREWFRPAAWEKKGEKRYKISVLACRSKVEIPVKHAGHFSDKLQIVRFPKGSGNRNRAVLRSFLEFLNYTSIYKSSGNANLFASTEILSYYRA